MDKLMTHFHLFGLDSDTLRGIQNYLASKLNTSRKQIPSSYSSSMGLVSTVVSVSFGKAETVPFSCIHHSFSHYAVRYPDSISLEHQSTSLTYGELHRHSDSVALRLRDAGIGRGSRVCLLVKRNASMVIGILSVLKAGASYIPIDGGIIKDDTLDIILRDSRPALILCTSAFHQRAQNYNIPNWDLDIIINDPLHIGQSFTQNKTLPSDEAYVIYTSGTTGRPKGVSVSHRNVTNLICTYPGNLGIRPGKRVAQLLNIAFDMAAWEILGCLANGGTLVLRGSSPKEWEQVLKSVDVIVSTPSILSNLDPLKYLNIGTVATAGEQCSQQLADRRASGREFFNCCGPTEVTIINTAHDHSPGVPISIGKPTPNNSVYVLNEELGAVPIGTPGILWAGGAGICRGYINLPHLTEARFKPDLFIVGGGTMYNTGDVGCMRPNGKIEHLGRVDDQVKVKGFRVELDGVAASISACPDVSLSCALYIGEEIWGIYCPSTVPKDVVKCFVSRTQPYYAIPGKYMCLDYFRLQAMERSIRKNCNQ